MSFPRNWRATLTIAPSDTVDVKDDVTNNPRAYPFVYVQTLTAGNLVVKDATGVDRTFTAIPVGTFVQFPVTRIMSTGTTATMVGLVPGNQ